MHAARYLVDPDDPRAPSQEVWDSLDEHERRRIVESLPSEIESADPPEGDPHRIQKTQAFDALDEFYRRIGRRVYLSAELPIYYPGERLFAPDLIAVRDVDLHPRMSWIVSKEGKSIDLALEIAFAGKRRKDFEANVVRFARLGVPEYFAFDGVRQRLSGWRLPGPGADRYEPILPQEGRWSSAVLELDLIIDGDRLRFYHGSAPLLDARELIGRLSTMVDEAIRRAEDEVRRAEDEARRAEDEARRAEKYAEHLRKLGVDPDDIH